MSKNKLKIIVNIYKEKVSVKDLIYKIVLLNS